MTTPTTTVSAVEVADRLFAAVASGDVAAVEALYAPDCIVWHNFDNIGQTVAENLRTLRWLTRNVSNLSYDERRCEETASGFLEQHVMRGADKAGNAIEVPVCMIGTVVDGKITRIDEYLDSAQIPSLLAP
jgi:ketosteroid isomerase-like protein